MTSISSPNPRPTHALRSTRPSTTASTGVDPLAILDAFIGEHGHASVPQHYVTADGFALGARVKQWRRAHKKRAGQTTTAFESELEARKGWLWEASKANRAVTPDGRIHPASDDMFAERVRALRLFSHEHGHTFVPQSTVTVTGVELGLWVRAQRFAYRRSLSDPHRNISDQRVATLEAVPNWTWEGRAGDAQWLERFAELRDYADTHGTSLAPGAHKNKAGLSFGKWASSQRVARKAGTLTDDQIASLESLPGWVWDASFVNNTFDARIAELRAHAAENTPGTPYPVVLERWAGRRRSENARQTLRAERTAVLNTVPGWTWDGKAPLLTTPSPQRVRRTTKRRNVSKPMSDLMRNNLDRLDGFIAAHGHGRVPHQHVEPDGMRLGLVVKNLQDRRDTLHPDVRAHLDALRGWTWSKPAMWDLNEALEALDEYVAATGTAHVPRAFVTPTGVALGIRVHTWRRQHHDGTISQAVAAELASKPGWSWGAKSHTLAA